MNRSKIVMQGFMNGVSYSVTELISDETEVKVYYIAMIKEGIGQKTITYKSKSKLALEEVKQIMKEFMK